MTDAVTLTATAPAVPQPISAGQAAQMLAEQRAAQATKPNASEAARILNAARAAKALQRTTEAPEQVQESAPQADGSDVEDDQAPEGEARDDDTASADTPEVAETEAQDDPGNGTIDLGDGISMTKDEVRESIMLKADHTKRLMALSDERKAFEADRTQRISILDNLIGVAQAQLGQPKSMKQWLADDPIDGMMKFAEQQERLEQFGNLLATRQQEQAHHVGQLKQATIKGLSTDFGDKAESVFTEAVQYVASKTGTDARAIEAMLAHPEAVKMVADAKAYRELKAKEGDVKRTIAEKPKVTKPGAKVSAQSQNQTAAQNARAKLKSSGSLADAVAYLQAQRRTSA